MKNIRLFSLIIFVLGFHYTNAQNIRYSNARIHLDSLHTVKRLVENGISVEGISRKGKYVESVFSEKEIEKAGSLGYRVDIIHQDAIAYYLEHVKNRPATKNGMPCDSNGSYEVPSGFNLGSMGGFLTYSQMLDELDDMHNQYPDLITEKSPISNFTTVENRPIYWLRISDNPGTDESDEPEILYTAVHHAREPASMQQLIFFMWYLLENYDTDPDVKFLVDHTEFYFVPMVNPDGYVYNETTNPDGGGMWRKNRRNNGDGSFGVDLNRNYSFHWNETGTSGPDGETYAGTAPFSEAETQAIKWLVNHHNFKMALNNHTFSELLLFPYGYDYNTYTPDHDLYQEFTAYLVSENGYTNEISSELYAASGDSDDWMYGDTSGHEKIFAMTPEIGYSFWPAQEDIIPICQEMMFLNLSAARLIHDFAGITDWTPELWEDTGGNFTYSIKGLGILNTGTFSVSISPVSGNISFEGSPQTYTLDFGDEQTGSFAYTLDENISQGDEIEFIVSIDNGTYTREMHFRKTYGEAIETFTEPGDDLSQWNTYVWGISTAQYHSPPSSITDSPSGNYSSYANNTIVLSNPVDLNNATGAKLSFWAKWDVEAGWDYVQLEISDDGGNSWEPQCGKFTTTGSSQQEGAEGEPVYDGHSSWVLEEIDLSGYLDSEILIRFKLVSDGAVEEDGFYFDDLKIFKVQTTGTGSSTGEHYSLFPNPAIHSLEVTGLTGKSLVEVFDTAGRCMIQNYLYPGHSEIDVTGLTAGVYLLRITGEKETQSVRFVKK